MAEGLDEPWLLLLLAYSKSVVPEDPMLGGGQ